MPTKTNPLSNITTFEGLAAHAEEGLTISAKFLKSLLDNDHLSDEGAAQVTIALYAITTGAMAICARAIELNGETETEN